jgi:hypothetical protein
MNACPVCGSRRIVRSRTRIGLESVRRKLTTKRPYRCFNCKWRGWLDYSPEASSSVGPTDVQPDLVDGDPRFDEHAHRGH